MSLTSKTKFKGKILFVDQNKVYRSTKNSIFKSTDNGTSWNRILRFSVQGFIKKIGYQSHLTRRLLRLGVHHYCPGQNGSGIIYDKSTGIVKGEDLCQVQPLIGSRPLSLEEFNQGFIFGEYRSNPERSEINVWQFGGDKELHSIFKFKGIRHIHGIYKDPYTEQLWITTGDEDDEAAIYCSNDNLETVEKILFGSQQTRTIKLLFTADFIYFGSDAPHEVNYLYRLHRDSKKVEQLQQVGSSVFHACKVGDWLFFSTAIEPSQVNTTKYAEVWASSNGEDWKCIYKFKKDRLPMRYFQYGQVFFPNGSGDDINLWISPFATEYDNTTFKIDLNQVKNRFEQCLKNFPSSSPFSPNSVTVM